jgi:hypothetical protein
MSLASTTHVVPPLPYAASAFSHLALGSLTITCAACRHACVATDFVTLATATTRHRRRRSSRAAAALAALSASAAQRSPCARVAPLSHISGRRHTTRAACAAALSAQRSSCMPQCAAPPRGSHAALPAAPHRPPATTQPPPQPLPSQPWPLPALPYSPMICHLACAVHCEATSSLQTTRLWQARLGRALLLSL